MKSSLSRYGPGWIISGPSLLSSSLPIPNPVCAVLLSTPKVPLLITFIHNNTILLLPSSSALLFDKSSESNRTLLSVVGSDVSKQPEPAPGDE